MKVTDIFMRFRYGMIKKTTGAKNSLYTFSILLLLVLAFITFALSSWQGTFSLKATTEILQIKTSENLLDWALKDVEIAFDKNPIAKYSGYLSIDSGTIIDFQNRSDGFTYLSLRSADPKKKIASFLIEEDGTNLTQEISSKIDAFNHLQIRITDIPKNLKYIFPFQGQLTVGDTVHSQVSLDNQLLQHGEVEILGSTVIGNSRFKALDATIDSGEKIKFIKDTKISVNGYGFITIDKLSSMDVRYYVEADFIQVSRYGSDGYHIEPTMWDRLSNDPSLKAAILIITTAVSMYITYWFMSVEFPLPTNNGNRKKGPSQKKKQQKKKNEQS